MSKAKDFLEMAAPLQKHTGGVFYHGTRNEEAAKGIQSKGLLPDQVVSKGFLKPVEGKVYITPSIRYALIYALGGDVAGSASYKYRSGDGRFGYVFVVPGSELKDIQPDEDSIGEMVHYNKIAWLTNLAKSKLTSNILKKVMEGGYMYWSKAGKRLVSLMSDGQKLNLIEAGAHIAHTGALKPSEVWQVDRERTPEFSRDGSNFFEVATRINKI